MRSEKKEESLKINMQTAQKVRENFFYFGS